MSHEPVEDPSSLQDHDEDPAHRIAELEKEVTRLKRSAGLWKARAQRTKSSAARHTRTAFASTEQILAQARGRRLRLARPIKVESKNLKSLARGRAGFVKKLTRLQERGYRGAKFTRDDELKVSFFKSWRTNAKASLTECREDHVRSSEIIVTAAIRKHVLQEMANLTEGNREYGELIAVWSGRKFDTAKSTLRTPVELPLVGSLSRSQTTQCPSIFLSKRLVVTVFERAIVTYAIPCIPVPTNSTSCGAVRTCIDTGSAAKPFQDACEKLMDAAPYACEFDAMDGASANEKYFYWRESKGDMNRAKIACGNHKNHLTDAQLEKLHKKQGGRSSFIVERCSGSMPYWVDASSLDRFGGACDYVAAGREGWLPARGI